MLSVIKALAASAALALLSPAISAQNLVPNPGFETFSTCPTTDGQLPLATGWTIPNGSTPDYLNACASFPYSVPSNVWGNQAGSGGSDGYMSCIVYSLSAPWREYGEIELTSPLVAGNTYEIKFRVSLAEMSSQAIAELGAHVNVGPHVGAGGGLMAYTPQVENTTLITDTAAWTEVSGTFVAAGGETHLAIGNFNDNASTTATMGSGPAMWSVYYVDDVSLEDVTPGGGGCPTTLIGWSDLPFPSTLGYLDTQSVDPCEPARTVCTTTDPFRALTSWAGGTAYDPRYGTAWVSDGVTVAEYYVQGARRCRPRCRPFRATLSTPGALVSGLTMSVRDPRLFQLATAAGAMEITVYDLQRCPANPRVCRDRLPTGYVAAGIAYDPARDLLYVSLSSMSGSLPHLLRVYSASAPCRPLCEARIRMCTRRVITGLAYDPCDRRLYATDGALTQTIEVQDPRRCAFRALDCCPKGSLPTYRGLAVVRRRVAVGGPAVSAGVGK